MNTDKHFIILLLIIVSSCIFQTDYEKMLHEELQSGKRSDSLFLDFHFGMPEKAFLDQCWEYNQQGILSQGSLDGQIAILYNLEELKHPASMNFFPTYHENKINSMKAVFKYNGWSPWNKSMHADSLQVDVVRLFEKWYKNKFLVVKHEEKGLAYVTVDGNRRITVFADEDTKQVTAIFSDLTVEFVKP